VSFDGQPVLRGVTFKIIPQRPKWVALSSGPKRFSGKRTDASLRLPASGFAKKVFQWRDSKLFWADGYSQKRCRELAMCRKRLALDRSFILSVREFLAFASGVRPAIGFWQSHKQTDELIHATPRGISAWQDYLDRPLAQTFRWPTATRLDCVQFAERGRNCSYSMRPTGGSGYAGGTKFFTS